MDKKLMRKGLTIDTSPLKRLIEKTGKSKFFNARREACTWLAEK